MAKIGKWTNNPLKGLGKALKAKGFTGKPDVSGQKKSAPDKQDPRSDEEIFLDAMSGIKEIP
ncbi:hypothetical protein LCGC14_1585880, partial [marine sediment metagenome]